MQRSAITLNASYWFVSDPELLDKFCYNNLVVIFDGF